MCLRYPSDDTSSRTLASTRPLLAMRGYALSLAEIIHAETVLFPEATDDWSVPPYLAVVDATTAGNLLYFQDSFPPAGPIEAGDVATVYGVKVLMS